MTTTSPEYPKTAVLWRGVILRAILHAIMISKELELAALLSWDGKNYVINNLDGTYGAITFDGGNVVGVFFDAQSRHNPFGSDEKYDMEQFLAGMPKVLRSLAEEQTLRYNRQTYQGKAVPLITAAFWSEGEYLTAAFPWQEVLSDGAHIISNELLDDTEAALREWQDAYQCSSEELALARSLFERNVANPSTPIVLSHSDLELLRKGSQDSGALTDSLNALEPTGIYAPVEPLEKDQK